MRQPKRSVEEFTARSGNHVVVVAIYAQEDGVGAVALEVEWDRDPSPEDLSECNAYFYRLAAKERQQNYVKARRN